MRLQEYDLINRTKVKGAEGEWEETAPRSPEICQSAHHSELIFAKKNFFIFSIIAEYSGHVLCVAEGFYGNRPTGLFAALPPSPHTGAGCRWKQNGRNRRQRGLSRPLRVQVCKYYTLKNLGGLL